MLCRRLLRKPPSLILMMAGLSLSGCSIVSPAPLWELAKATGSLASMAMATNPGESSNTVYHVHDPLKELCIEFNPQAQVADIVPALQIALRQHQIESRVYEGMVAAEKCSVWLKYSAFIDWGQYPLSDRYKPYVSKAALTLQTARGQILSSSHYELDPMLGTSRWASTQDKLAPVVSALLSGIESKPAALPTSQKEKT
ncbi:MAG: cell division protein FtsI [Burkholderiales bacterium]|nr:cell division protein FtsI [Burkholderiales bacterium]